MHTIIVPLDGSAFAERAIALGVPLASALDAEVKLIHVVPRAALTGVASIRTPPDFAAAQRYLDDVVRRLPAYQRVRTGVLQGDPAEEIIQLSHTDCDAVVAMATHGRSAFGRLAFGSVADKVVRDAGVPVALIGNSKVELEKSYRTIVVPLDGSQLAEAALPLAVALASRYGATISLVRVVDRFSEFPDTWYGSELADRCHTIEQMDMADEQLLIDARGYLERTAEALRLTYPSTVWEVRTGQPASEIRRLAETNPASIIVLASHGRGGLQRWAHGSVTTEIVHKSSAPVLVVPAATSLRVGL